MCMKKLKYIDYDIVFQEVPDETTLAINISGCPYRCEGCHSQYLWEYDGEYLLDHINDIINRYLGLFTCLCFMGGDQNCSDLLAALRLAKDKGVNTCLYTGCNDLDIIPMAIRHELNYIKIGSYKKELGGLDSKKTNQRFYVLNHGEIVDEITDWFTNRGIRDD